MECHTQNTHTYAHIRFFWLHLITLWYMSIRNVYISARQNFKRTNKMTSFTWSVPMDYLAGVVEFCVPHENLCKLNFLVFQQQTIKCLMCRNEMPEWRNSYSRLEIDYCCETGNCILDILSAFKWQHYDIQLQCDNSVDKASAQHAFCASTANIVIIKITRSDDAAASIDVFISHIPLQAEYMLSRLKPEMRK